MNDMNNPTLSSLPAWQTLAEFNLPGRLDAGQSLRDDVALAVQAINLPSVDLERLKTAVAEAVLNVVKHGNRNRPALPAAIRLRVSVKMSEQEASRGWGFFLIGRMVDEDQIGGDAYHKIELFLYPE